jgi:hypothetical protein
MMMAKPAHRLVVMVICPLPDPPVGWFAPCAQACSQISRMVSRSMRIMSR